MKNPQFLANQAETLAILPIHEMVILTKFHNDWMKIVDFSVIAYFWASPIFYYSLFKIGLAVSQKSRETWGKKSHFSRDSKSARL